MADRSSSWIPIPQDVSLLPVFRQLVELHTQMERTASRFLGDYDLTLPQFDVLATLGDMPPMTTKSLSEQSLISKGSLLPMLERLEARGLVQRAKCVQDCRQTLVSLTSEGQALYEQVFPAYVAKFRTFEDAISADEQKRLVRSLRTLKAAFGKD